MLGKSFGDNLAPEGLGGRSYNQITFAWSTLNDPMNFRNLTSQHGLTHSCVICPFKLNFSSLAFLKPLQNLKWGNKCEKSKNFSSQDLQIILEFMKFIDNYKSGRSLDNS